MRHFGEVSHITNKHKTHPKSIGHVMHRKYIDSRTTRPR